MAVLAVTRARKFLSHVPNPRHILSSITEIVTTTDSNYHYAHIRPPLHAFQPLRCFAMPPGTGLRAASELRADLEKEMQRVNISGKKEDAENDEDYTGVALKIAKLERQIGWLTKQEDNFVEPSDSEREEDDRFRPEELKKKEMDFGRKCRSHEELLKKFAYAGWFK